MPNGKRGGRPPKVTREEIVYAARKLGLDQASVRNIADELGVSSVTVYNYFSNKEEIVDFSIKMMIDKTISSLSDLNTFEETLKQIAKKYFELICANCLIVFRVIEGNVFPASTASCVDTLISYGMKRGLTSSEALFALRSVLQAAAGCAVTRISQPGAIIPGVDEGTEKRLRSGEATELGHLCSALKDPALDPLDPQAGIGVALLGLRAMFGDRMTSAASNLQASV